MVLVINGHLYSQVYSILLYSVYCWLHIWIMQLILLCSKNNFQGTNILKFLHPSRTVEIELVKIYNIRTWLEDSRTILLHQNRFKYNLCYICWGWYNSSSKWKYDNTYCSPLDRKLHEVVPNGIVKVLWIKDEHIMMHIHTDIPPSHIRRRF